MKCRTNSASDISDCSSSVNEKEEEELSGWEDVDISSEELNLEGRYFVMEGYITTISSKELNASRDICKPIKTVCAKSDVRAGDNFRS